MPRWAVVVIFVVAGLAVIAGLYFAFRPASETTAPPATTAGTTEQTATTEETTTQETTTEAERATLRITVRGGEPVGGIQHLTVRKGQEVRVRVEADVADEVHVHGYDLMQDVAPGEEARIEFEATIVGRFEIELEDRGVPIAELEVRP
ncbi:MAG: hypothetical protein WD981_01955 [Gaiellaceae bacterium]